MIKVGNYYIPLYQIREMKFNDNGSKSLIITRGDGDDMESYPITDTEHNHLRHKLEVMCNGEI